MIKREELLKTEEFWFETLQNEIYRMVSDYINKKGMSQTQLATQLGVSRAYISQIMNGNFNYTLKKLIELSLAVDKAPNIDFKNLNEFIKEDHQKRFEMNYQPYFNVIPQADTISVHSGNKGTANKIEPSKIYYSLKVA